jgi:tRNA A-37 threonylcarbamoyl transferase component Bud32
MEPVVLNNRYRLLELVGSGGMAVVYRGVDTLLQRRIAVKVLRESFASDPAFLARFQREAQAAASLDHPNVVTVYDVGHDGSRHYIVMEYVDGQDLKTLIRQKGHLSVDETLDIAIQVSAGVGHAHKASFIHCDIKPQNVLVTRDGRVKVTDFGIARALSETGLTESEIVWGSPTYFSPEQAAGEPPSPASDVYSIGIMMYEMLSGLPPFQAEKSAALALMHMREEPAPLASRNPQVPPQLEWIIRKVLAKEPSARYRNAEQLAHVLDEYRKHGEQPTGWQAVAPSLASTKRVTERTVAVEGVADVEPEPAPQAGSDGLTWLLGGIALLLVVGLIPWWMLALNAWNRGNPAPVPTRTPKPFVTLAPTTQEVSVPDVLGKSPEEARWEVERRGLRFRIAERRDEPGVDEEIVLQQTPSPGARVPFDSEVSVVVSGSERELTVQDLVGLPVALVKEGLESDGLNVVVDPLWSPEAGGTVLLQEPEVDTVVHTGDTITLTVSGGLDVPIVLEVNLADTVVLEKAELRQAMFRPGETIEATLYWKPLHTTSMRYVVFVHLVDGGGNLVAQQDVEPRVPTTEWGTSVLADSYQVAIPAGLPAGSYQLRTGMYRQGQPSVRLPVADPGRTTVESDSILIAGVEVRP